MFFKKTIKDIKLNEKVLKKSRVPILIKDSGWKKVFEPKKNRFMENLSKNLEALLNEERELKKEIRGKNERKLLLVKKILKLSELVNRDNREDALEEMERCKLEMQHLSTEIESLFLRLEELPREIEQNNLALLKETIKIAYDELSTNKNSLTTTDEEINTLRNRLGELRDQKEELEKKIDFLYSFLHTMVGYEEMESLDHQLLDTEN
ncbi:hypothetical protein [Alkaliphilus peptidifermentans]|uniref:Uncharacterized protein n=1 Tax=Alkaliphilus peptidifermentans DSM 18978 TaxID=1120976 RepID=A0A1G5GDX3_9FIRM|nr:hypothetical protein [Alkaliphilus peptidifermentans]SCY49450.1 hypothetical protein SAMN03080606_01646 [Alkaliphilus peptidifermentans DSM 18978]